jgi:hypothetical protein
MHTKFLRKEHVEDLVVDWESYRMGLGETEWVVVHWIQMLQDRDQWRAFVNTSTWGFKKGKGKFVPVFN